jgi:hypothetical protein
LRTACMPASWQIAAICKIAIQLQVTVRNLVRAKKKQRDGEGN